MQGKGSVDLDCLRLVVSIPFDVLINIPLNEGHLETGRLLQQLCNFFGSKMTIPEDYRDYDTRGNCLCKEDTFSDTLSINRS